MKQLTYEVIKEAYRLKNWKFDESKLNITGVRTNNIIPDSFNDYLICTWKEAGTGKMFGGMATTEPGAYWLSKPMNVKGTAVIVPGYYENVWQIGNHHGYEALVQAGVFKVWRDNDRSNSLPVYSGLSAIDKLGNNLIPIPAGAECGLNCHRALEGLIIKTVGKFSAGCQVWENSALFNRMMKLAKQSGQKRFSYGLFTENDFL